MGAPRTSLSFTAAIACSEIVLAHAAEVSQIIKKVSLLQMSDLRAHPVWRFKSRDESGETLVTPVTRLPVTSLALTLVATDVVLACGKKLLAAIGNVDVQNAERNRHFVTLSLYRDDGAVFNLARYHDVDFADRGPAQLAAFLGLNPPDVFPIAWDVGAYAVGSKEALKGFVVETAEVRLDPQDRDALALRGGHGHPLPSDDWKPIAYLFHLTAFVITSFGVVTVLVLTIGGTDGDAKFQLGLWLYGIFWLWAAIQTGRVVFGRQNDDNGPPK